MPATPRAVVVVTEGASPELLDRWCRRGWLPNFTRLLGQGSWGPLESDGVPYEPPGLVSLLTGRRPGDHGVFSYWSCHDPGYHPQVLDRNSHQFPLLWQHDDLAGLKWGSVGLFGTHPPSELDGWLVTYPMATTLHACWPPSLHRELAGQGIKPVHDVSIWWHGQARDELLPRLLEADARRGETALTMYDKGADVTVVNLTSIDRCSHIYWQELELDDAAEAGAAVLQAYQTADGIIGRFLDRMDGNTTLLAFSEIGFGPLRAYCSMNDELAKAGLYARDGEGAVDWDKTVGFEAVQGTHGVNVNLVGRYEGGSVAESDYEKARDDLAAALLASVNPRTGLPYLSGVLRREELHEGERADNAPDLILEPADWRYLPLGDQRWASHVRRDWQSGWHRPNSYWAAIGANAVPRASAGTARPVDMAAAVVVLVGRDVPADFTGQVPWEQQ